MLEGRLAAADALGADEWRLDTGSPHTTELPLAKEHAPLFSEWLQKAALRASAAGQDETARILNRIRRFEG